jgi:hypothetical protein
MADNKPPVTTTDAGIPAASDEHSLTAGPNGPILLQDHYRRGIGSSRTTSRLSEPYRAAFGHLDFLKEVRDPVTRRSDRQDGEEPEVGRRGRDLRVHADVSRDGQDGAGGGLPRAGRVVRDARQGRRNPTPAASPRACSRSPGKIRPTPSSRAFRADSPTEGAGEAPSCVRRPLPLVSVREPRHRALPDPGDVPGRADRRRCADPGRDRRLRRAFAAPGRAVGHDDDRDRGQSERTSRCSTASWGSTPGSTCGSRWAARSPWPACSRPATPIRS